MPHKIFYISGPTRTGKTLLVKSLQAEDKLVLGSGSFQEIIIEMCQNKEISAIDGLLSAFEFYRLLCIEDVDIILTGRTCTQELVSEFLENYLKNEKKSYQNVPCSGCKKPLIMLGIPKIELAKIIGITPLMLTLTGICAL